MVVDGAREVRPSGRRGLLPWVVRLAVGVGVLTWIVLDEIRTYGLEREGPWRPGVPMAVSIMVATVIAVGVLAALEGWCARRTAAVGWQCLLAAIGAAAVAWSAGLMVGLRFVGMEEPVLQSEIESALSSFVLMAVPYALLALLFRRTTTAGRGRRLSRPPSGVDDVTPGVDRNSPS